MDNLFITQYFDWNRPPSRKVRWVNALLSKLGLKARLVTPRATGEQSSVEQRINLYHLASQMLHHGVPGDFVEIGAHHGGSAALLQEVLKANDAARQLHVYDAFFDSSAEQLQASFNALGLASPQIHAGLVQNTIPSELPARIAFAHVDIGWHQLFDEQREIVLRCLAGIYPNLTTGAICVVADYCEPNAYVRQKFTPPPEVAKSDSWNLYPAMQSACDEFLSDKPEKMTLLYGGPYSHGYFRKQPAVPPR